MRNTILIKAILASLFLFSLLTTMFAQSSAIMEIARVESINFDGLVSDDEWLKIPPVPLVQYSPDAGAAPTEKTEIRFAYDDEYFYASIRAYDSEPDKIRGNSLYRDRLAGSDHFEILLDSYNDNESAIIFNTISTGVRTDAAIYNDATGGTISSSAWINSSFNTFWDTKVSRDQSGWYAETRIPFSSLRFQNIGGNVIMGLTVQRKIARKLERLVFPNIKPENNWAFLKPSLAQKILIKGIEPTKTVYISPYVLAGLRRSNALSEDGSMYDKLTDFQREIGGDVKFSVTNNVTMDFTINTDFAQAEADDQLVNLSRFSLFFPEKRQFFQERAGVFEFRTGGLSRLFFSRRIGLTGDGTPVPIIGGVRLVGRSNDLDIGVLNMQTRRFEGLNTENFGVLRVKKRVINNQSTLGAIITNRSGPTGRNNLAYGIDGLFRLFGDDFLTINWSQTFNDLDTGDPHSLDQGNGRITIEFNRRRRSGFGYNVGAIYSGGRYDPGLGFVDRENFKFGTATLSHTKLFSEGSSFIYQTFGITGSTYIDNDTDKTLSAEIGPEWRFSTRTQDSGHLGFAWQYENLFQDFSLSNDVFIPVGIYKFGRFSASYRMAGEKLIRTAINIETGTFYDGWLNTISISPSWFVSKHLELGLQYSYNNATFSDRDQKFDIHVARLKVGTAVNNKISTNAFVQVNSEADLISANIRFRYNFREGNDFWLVLNEGINTDRFSRTPTLPRSNSESILVKYVHTFL